MLHPLATLFLSHLVLGIFAGSVETNLQWASRLGEYGVLRTLAAEANAPGNQVFSTRAIERESRALESAREQFHDKLAIEREALAELPPGEDVERLAADLELVESAFAEMIDASRDIFRFFRSGDEAEAGAAMTEMDEGFYRVISAIRELEDHVRAIQFAHLASQSERASALRRYEVIIAIFVVLILAAGTRYGKLVSRQFERSQRVNRSQMIELREKHEALEDARRIAEAARREAERDRRAAEAANQSKSQFLANMSHEIRTPMTAILGFAEHCLEADIDEEEKNAAIGTILRNGDHLLTLINDILDVSKIEAGQLDLERVETPLLELFHDLEKLVQPIARKKGLGLSFEFRNSIPEKISTDPTRLRQAVLNLLGNAVKFTEEGSVRVITRLLPASDGNRSAMLEVAVEDTGIGVSALGINRLFKPFSQADSSMTRRFGGTGLGLTISRELCRNLGGDITVESTPGEGSRFTLTIETGPLGGVRLLEPNVHLKTHSDRKPVTRGGTLDCSVLLAEDGPDNQVLIRLILEKAGAEVTLAENGQEAVEALLDSEQTLDVVLMGMQMPVLDGYGATTELRRRGYRGPILALTAHAMQGEREKCIAAGCDDFASKPIDRKRLIALVGHWAEMAEKIVGDASPPVELT